MKNLIIISLDCARREAFSCYNLLFNSMLHKKIGFLNFFGSEVIYSILKPIFDLLIRICIKPSTPAIDRIANDGILFVNAFTQAPYTPAAHASLFTGLNPYNHGIRRMIGLKLNESAKTLSEVLKEHGYVTAGFLGSNALGKEYGLDRGFDIYDFSPEHLCVTFGEKTIYRRSCKNVTNSALEWLQKEKENKFSLFIHYFDAHEDESNISYHPFWQINKIKETDKEIQRILNFLDNNNIYDNTVIIIIADHGNSFGEHEELAHKEFLYDSTLRIPMIMKLDEAHKNQKSSCAVSLIDIFPTVLEFLNLPNNYRTDGVNIIDMFRISLDEYTKRMFYSETAFEKSTEFPDDLKNRHISLRNLKWKLIIDIISGKKELYDMINDPLELNNVFQSHPDVTSEFLGYLSKTLEQEKPYSKNLMTEAELLSTKEILRSLGYL